MNGAGTTVRKLGVLFQKDLRTGLRNATTLLFMLLPIGFTALYGNMSFGGEHMEKSFVLQTGLLMAICMMPPAAMSMMIAEEKEKNTLRTLIVSNVPAWLFLLSKALLVLLITEVVCVAVYVVARADMGIGIYLAASSLAALSLLLIGAVIGIFSKNQMSTSLLSTPVLMLMLIPPIFAQLSEPIARVARFLPTYAMVLLLSRQDTLASVLVMVAWIVLAAGLFMWAYRRAGRD